MSTQTQQQQNREQENLFPSLPPSTPTRPKETTLKRKFSKKTPTRPSSSSLSTTNQQLTQVATADEGDLLDESFATTTTEATTYVSDISTPMHYSPFSLWETPEEDSAEFLTTLHPLSCHLPLDSEQKNVHVHLRNGSLDSDHLVEFRCPSPNSSNRRTLRAKRRTRSQHQHHQLLNISVDDSTTPLGISGRRRSFHQCSAYTEKGTMLISPPSSSEERSSPDLGLNYDANKPVATPRHRRSQSRPQVLLSDSESLLRQPLAHIQLTIRRLRANGVVGMLCLAVFCFTGMVFVTSQAFVLLEEQRQTGRVQRPETSRLRTFQPDAQLVNGGGLRGVVSYAAASRNQNKRSAAPFVKLNLKDDLKKGLDKHKTKTSSRHHGTSNKRKKTRSLIGKDYAQLLESKQPTTILAELEAERRVSHEIGNLITPPPKLWISNKASFDLLDSRMYQPTEKVKPSAAAPRVVSLDASWTSTMVSRRIEQYPAEFTDNTQLYSILDSADERLQRMELREPFVQGECVPMQDWQTKFDPSCNVMHELGMEYMGEEDVYKVALFGTKGYWRNAWKFESQETFSETGDRDTFVVKTLKFQHDFEEAHFEHSRIDAVAMERLTASPHVINIFGFCGHSVLTEYADGKRVGELADKMKRTPLARLRIARDIANGLADVHGIDGDGNSTFVHFDVNLANVVSIGSTLKLNDFNIGIIRRWNTTSNTPCGFPAQYPNPQWRSPEEARNEQNLTEKVDVFSMGHIFFRLICGHEPWNKLEPGGKPSKEVINEKVKQGVLPFILPEVMNTTDIEVAAIRDAMMQCYAFDPSKRPSARDIARQLDRALAELSSSSSSQST